ncbi:MAG TPA: hydrogen peroxide-inducible genes activator [Gammaproteobacteria bacterium]|nr:hydrogen peroxide-inducible genes activator [Gammaproteobacteria bacterium]
MTLTELRYIVAVARTRHFGQAAQQCFVSQPTLSVAIRKLEDQLNLKIFERKTGDISLTPIGERIVIQAQRVLEETEQINVIAQQTQDPLAKPLRAGAIYSIAPYLLPHFIPEVHKRAPDMPLLLEESYTAVLSEQLKLGQKDVIIISLPFDEAGIETQALYDEPFVVALPAEHPWNKNSTIDGSQLTEENLFLLGAGHCFRDQVLQHFPALGQVINTNALQRTLEGSSLETIRQMVATGAGVSIFPCTAVMDSCQTLNKLVSYRPLTPPAPSRRIAIAWRKQFPRPEAIEVIRQSILAATPDCIHQLNT